MAVTQGSDKDVRAQTRLNKQFADFETPAIKCGKGCERVNKILKPGLRWKERESRSATYVVYCKNCIIFPFGHIKSPIIRQLATVTSGLLNKAFDNKVLTPQTRPGCTQGQRQWREKERGELFAESFPELRHA